MKSIYGLVGMKYRGTEAALATLPNGSPLALKRDRDNQYDPNAVQVWASVDGREVHLGFVKASQVRALAERMDADPTFAAMLTSGTTVRLALDGGKWPLLEVDE